MIRIHLDETTREELQALRRQDLPARVRDRLEMVLLSAAGWSAPRIAAHLGCHHHTARAAVKGFLREGAASLWPDKPGPGPDQARRELVTSLLRELLGQDRTWTSRQLADSLRPHGVELSGRQVRRYLKLLKAGYRRTASTLEHKQDPEKVARAEAALGSLKKKRRRAG
jgi:putative transposase